jgi:hypothetical protein
VGTLSWVAIFASAVAVLGSLTSVLITIISLKDVSRSERASIFRALGQMRAELVHRQQTTSAQLDPDDPEDAQEILESWASNTRYPGRLEE